MPFCHQWAISCTFHFARFYQSTLEEEIDRDVVLHKLNYHKTYTYVTADLLADDNPNRLAEFIQKLIHVQ